MNRFGVDVLEKPKVIPELSKAIAYPGITAEIVGDGKHIFEPNFNCGTLGVALSYLDQVEEKDRELLYKFAINIFEEVRENHEKLILIGDESLLEVQYLQNILKGIFGEENFSIVTTQMSLSRKNLLTGSAIRSSVFSDEDVLINEIKGNPDAIVLSTIPYSDPRIGNILSKLNGLEETIAYKSLGLLGLNSDRRNHVEVAGKEMGNLGIVSQKGEIFEFLGENVKELVLKNIDGSAGGTGVNVLLNDAQIEAFDNKADFNYSYIVNRFINPKVLRSIGEEFPFHIRPFFSSSGEYLGSGLKFSGKPINHNVTGAGVNAFKKIEEGFNTSSGNSSTFIFDKNGNVIIGFAGKNYGYLGAKEALEYLSGFEFEGQKLTPAIINDLALNSFDIIRNIQSRTNTLLGLN